MSAVESIFSLRYWPTTIPTRGARPSQRAKINEVLTDRRRLGLSPPRTIEIRKLSKLSVSPSVSSEITGTPRPLAADTGELALQLGSYPLLPRGQVSRDPSAGRSRGTTEKVGRRPGRGRRAQAPRRHAPGAHSPAPSSALGRQPSAPSSARSGGLPSATASSSSADSASPSKRASASSHDATAAAAPPPARRATPPTQAATPAAASRPPGASK